MIFRISYKEIRDFTLSIETPSERNIKKEICILSWESTKSKQKYTIPLQSRTEKNRLIEVLKYLYAKGMNIKEYNEKGEKTHLLQSIKPMEFEEKYIDLIDEIGTKRISIKEVNIFYLKISYYLKA